MDNDLLPMFPEPQAPAEQHDKKNPKDSQNQEKFTKAIVNLDMRLKILEDRYGNMRKKTQVTEQNMIESENELWDELKTLNEDLLEMKKKISELLHKMSAMSDELKNAATKYDLKVVEKYLDMWQPMRFLTRDDLEREKSLDV